MKAREDLPLSSSSAQAHPQMLAGTDHSDFSPSYLGRSMNGYHHHKDEDKGKAMLIILLNCSLLFVHRHQKSYQSSSLEPKLPSAKKLLDMSTW